jgi:hypothetical protein
MMVAGGAASRHELRAIAFQSRGILMKRRQVAARPRLETLESVTLLSGLAAPPAIVSALAAASTTRELALHGQFKGVYGANARIPDAGTSYALSGSGKAGRLGHMAIHVDLQSTGFIARGNSTGTLTLSGPKGTLKLQLVGPTQSGFARLPATYSYSVSGGTGRFAHVKDQGTITLSLVPFTVPTSATLATPAIFVEAGNFKLTIASTAAHPA